MMTLLDVGRSCLQSRCDHVCGHVAGGSSLLISILDDAIASVMFAVTADRLRCWIDHDAGQRGPFAGMHHALKTGYRTTNTGVKSMKNLAITVITMGMLAPACGGRGTPQEVLNPLPAFAEYEPQRAPLLIDEEELQAEAAVQAHGTPQDQELPRAAIVIMGMTEAREAPSLDPVYFAFGSAILDPADQEQLGDAAKWLREHPDQQVLIEGHTDAVGPSQYNLALGEQRARAVRDYLIQLGVDEQRVEIVSLGEAQPVSEERRDLNRRSEVVPVPEATDPR